MIANDGPPVGDGPAARASALERAAGHTLPNAVERATGFVRTRTIDAQDALALLVVAAAGNEIFTIDESTTGLTGRVVDVDQRRRGLRDVRYQPERQFRAAVAIGGALYVITHETSTTAQTLIGSMPTGATTLPVTPTLVDSIRSGRHRLRHGQRERPSGLRSWGTGPPTTGSGSTRPPGLRTRTTTTRTSASSYGDRGAA